jgi:hypothetical protein
MSDTIIGLEDTSGNAITSMGASWTSRAYSMGDYSLLSAHLEWSDATFRGCYTLGELPVNCP